MYGLAIERSGLGKDHYATNANGETLSASYFAGTLSLAARFYLSERRPAMYLALAAGPALPMVSAAGTRAPGGTFVTPPQPYQCTDWGRVGAAAQAALGAELDMAEAWSFLAEARASGYFLSDAADAHGGCAPGSGPAVAGALRLGFGYRFGS